MNKKIILVVFVFLAFASCATNRLSLNDNGQGQGLARPNGGWSALYSPDGGMIAFLSSTRHTPPDIWVMRPDGTGTRRLTTRGAGPFTWASDGKSILFAVRRRGFEEIFRVGIDGREEKIAGLPNDSSIPLYSPDGTLFAVTAPSSDKNVRDLWVGTADGKRLETVTEKIGIRSVFWGPDSRYVYYEVGDASYGVGIWMMDLATMESKAILETGHAKGSYIGPPQYSKNAGLLAYARLNPEGGFDVHAMKLDGSDDKTYKAPRLPGRWVMWDVEGKGVYYLGQDIKKSEKKDLVDEKKPGKEEKSHEHKKPQKRDFERVGVTGLWHLDFETGLEKRISPDTILVSEALLSPDGKTSVITGVREDSFGPEIFGMDLSSGKLVQLQESSVSSWLPVPTVDSSAIAFFTNEKAVDTLKIVDHAGREVVSYPGVIQEQDTRFFWLPKSRGLVLFSGRGIFAFTEGGKGEAKFKKAGDFKAYLSADVSIQEDKILLSAVPKYGESPGLYMLQVEFENIVLIDLRFPKEKGEDAPDVYLQPKWSFDGSKIVFTDTVDVWTMNADNTGRTRLTRYVEANEKDKGRMPLSSFPSWSPDGTMICYTLTVYRGETATRQLWMMKADGTDPRMLCSEEVKSKFQVFLPEYTHQPFFDVEGKQIIFTAVEKGLPVLASVNVKNGKIRRLTDSGAIFPALLPEDGVIIYTSLEGNAESLWEMNIDGTGKHPFIITKMTTTGTGNAAKGSGKPTNEMSLSGDAAAPESAGTAVKTAGSEAGQDHAEIKNESDANHSVSR